MKSFLKGRLDDYRHPVSDDLWASIEGDLDVKPRRLARPILIAVAGSAAAVALILSLVLPGYFAPEEALQPLADAVRIEKTEKTVSPHVQVEINEGESVAKRNIPTENYGRSGITPHKKTDPEHELKAETPLPSVSAPQPEAVSMPNERTDGNTAREDTVKEEKRSRGEIWPDDHASGRRTKHRLSLAFAVNGTAAGNASNTTARTMYHDGAGTDILSQVTDKKTKYDFPVSVAALLHIPLTKGLALETGLSYTFLSAREETTWNGETALKSSHKLHYLGVPLRLWVAFYENDRLSIYGSAGGMVEKLVSGNSKTVLQSTMKSENKKLTTNNVLWSVSGVVGANYKINRTWGLFIEPGVSYYFDDGVDAPTIRRDRPLNFNLQLGVRVSL